MAKKEKSLLDRFKNHIETSGLISQGTRGLLAVSGGVDSVVMADLFVSIKDSFKLMLGIAHFNHGTRSTESDEDELFVSDLACRYGLPFYSGLLTPQGSDSKDSWEAYARRNRYAFFAEVKGKEKYDWVATAHHADDQLETILLRIVEGTGLKGLKGIWQKNEYIIRPLLPFSKQEIIEFASKRNLTYREDSSNKDLSIPRNYLRLKVIPHIKSLNPNISSSIRRLSSIADEVNVTIDTITQNLKDQIVSEASSGKYILDFNRLSLEPLLIQKCMIQKLIHDKKRYTHWRHNTWLELERFLKHATTGRVLNLPDEWILLKDRNSLVLQKSKKIESESSREFTFNPDLHIEVKVNNHTFRMDIMGDEVDFTKNPFIEYIDYGCVKDCKLKLRPWHPGDRMQPLGMSGYKKVSDILVDKKIDLFTKQSQFVLIADDNIVWLCGVQLDDRFKISGTTREITRLSWTLKANYQK